MGKGKEGRIIFETRIVVGLEISFEVLPSGDVVIKGAQVAPGCAIFNKSEVEEALDGAKDLSAFDEAAHAAVGWEAPEDDGDDGDDGEESDT